jgi:hypothetical protein
VSCACYLLRTLVDFQQTTRCYIPKDRTLQTSSYTCHHCQKRATGFMIANVGIWSASLCEYCHYSLKKHDIQQQSNRPNCLYIHFRYVGSCLHGLCGSFWEVYVIGSIFKLNGQSTKGLKAGHTIVYNFRLRSSTASYVEIYNHISM